MKRIHKIGLITAGLGFSILFVSGCTANFCSDTDKTRLLFALEPGVSTYVDADKLEEVKALDEAENSKITEEEKKNVYTYELAFESGNTNLYRRVAKNYEGGFYKSSYLSNVIGTVKRETGVVPTDEYFVNFDQILLEKAVSLYNENKEDAEKYSAATLTADQANNALTTWGRYKFDYDANDENRALFDNFYSIHYQVVNKIGAEKSANKDFLNQYQTTMNSAIANNRSCISTFEVADKGYAAYGQGTPDVAIETKDWGYAWSKGFFEGLLVYPVSWMIDSFTGLFGGVSENGVNQLLALIVVTLIVRLFIFAATLPSTLQQQKMQALQPELAKIQAKYPNANTSQTEKQRLAQEQSKLYKKHGVHPFAQLLVMVIQFPIFICVWGAMTGATVLSRGTFLGLNLSTPISTALFNVAGWPNIPGWWTALVLILIMSVSQFLSMKVPQWLQKARAKKVARLGVNPAQTQQNKTMNIVSYVMLAFIIIMGFSLPAAMGVYWFLSAIISLGLSFVTQAIANASMKKSKGKK